MNRKPHNYWKRLAERFRDGLTSVVLDDHGSRCLRTAALKLGIWITREKITGRMYAVRRKW